MVLSNLNAEINDMKIIKSLDKPSLLIKKRYQKH